jgi:hypothetical protein
MNDDDIEMDDQEKMEMGLLRDEPLDTEVSHEDQTDPPRRGNTLLDTDDAMVWAEEFVRIFTGKVVGPDWDLDEGLMVGWFANAMAVGEHFHRDRQNCDGPYWSFLHFYSMDKANACMHCAPVRFSPITFRLWEFLRDAMPLLSIHSPEFREVGDHIDKYEEDRGR